MKLTSWISVVLATVMVSSAYADGPKVPAKHVGVFFKGSAIDKNIRLAFNQQSTNSTAQAVESDPISQPYVGIQVNKAAFIEFLTKVLEKTDSISSIHDVINKLFDPKLSPKDLLANAQSIFCVHPAEDDPDQSESTKMLACMVFEAILDEDAKNLTILVRQNYNIGLILEIDSASLSKGTTAKIESTKYESDVLRWKGRFSLSAKSKLTQEDLTLITKGMGSEDYDTGKGGTATFELAYKGLGLRPFGLRYYDFNLDATLGELSLYNKSSIELRALGATRFKTLPHTITVLGPKLRFTQSLSTVEALVDMRARFGDRRIGGRGFMPADETLKGMFLDLGAEFGYTTGKSLDRVEMGRVGGIFRPLINLGFAKQALFGAEFEGSITYFWLLNKLTQSASKERFVPVFDLKVSFGPEHQRLVLGVSGGRNPAEGFVKVKPTYSLGISVKM